MGTGLPLLAIAAVVSLGLGAAEMVAGRLGAGHRVLAGVHDMMVYWWL